MTPIELNDLYRTLRTRVAVYSEDGCGEILLPLPTDFRGELAFYRLVFWGHALVNEAARMALPFLMRLPPLGSAEALSGEMSSLRSYVSHNLDPRKKRDQRTYAFVHRWFRDACGTGTPKGSDHDSCCVHLGDRLGSALDGAIAACDLLDHEEDGPRLVEDLRGRLSWNWEAWRFDPLVADCAARLGNPGVDQLALRSKHVQKWRQVLASAEEAARLHVLEQRIEADLLEAIGDALPSRARRDLELVAGSTEATLAGLLLLREARLTGAVSLGEIVAYLRGHAEGLSQGDGKGMGGGD